HLVTGVGLYRFNPVIHKRLGKDFNSHNTPLTLLAELGLLGFLPYMTIFILCILYSVKAYLYQPESRALIAGLWGMASDYWIGLGAVERIGVLYVNTLFFALWGMVLGITQQRWTRSSLQGGRKPGVGYAGLARRSPRASTPRRAARDGHLHPEHA